MTNIAGIALSIFSLLAAHGGELPPATPVTVDLTAITQGAGSSQNKTNVHAGATNDILVITASPVFSRFGTSNLLALIGNSYHTNFPAGSRIALTADFLAEPVVVLGPAATDIPFYPASVISSVFTVDTNDVTLANINTDGINSWHDTQVTTQTTNGPSVSGVNNDIFYFGYALIYDDTALSPTDGKHSQFQLNGLFVEHGIVNLKTDATKISIQIQCTGGGQVDGVTTLLTGTIGNGKGK